MRVNESPLTKPDINRIKNMVNPEPVPIIIPFALVILELTYPLISAEIIPMAIPNHRSNSNGRLPEIRSVSENKHRRSTADVAPAVVPANNAFTYRVAPVCVILVLIVFKIKIP